ncbi:ABC transporter substrate-binding protein [Clostridium estertheticum]|uniref:ABC transporter substrate-binding protein n=1 Tax=Clostridium estertheticum TaxID=238834 RepID=UPI001CF1F3F6|nr:sugar ABC transporter substrate-binding protein [Clostridium estertheticum]MCB2352659.1 sugar ABC transporter substrate-binding protein [Clostridium estertheticum]WAG39970.1 sugar ABC transporter substrate-binding protein [Clostridium estertheticum]
MKRKALALTLGLLLTLATFTGCGTQTKKVAVGTDATKNKAVTITYAIWDSNQEKGLRTMADEFEKENSNIKIKIQVTGWADYWTALEAGATGGSLPDTFWMHSNLIYKYASNDQLLNLNDKIKASKKIEMDKFPSGLTTIYNYKSNQYAIPKDYDTIGLWYNKTMFDKAGIAYPNDKWTWTDLQKAAKKLTKADGSQYGILTPLHNQEGYYNFVYQNGGTIITKDKKSGYDDPKTVEAIKYYVNFVKDGLSPKEFGDAERATDIQSGKCAMGFFGSWNLSGFSSNDYMKKNFDVAVLPTSNNGGKASIFNGLGNAISKITKHPDESFKWIEYLSSKEGQTRQAQLGVAISAYDGTADAWVSSNKTFNIKSFIDMVKYAQIRPYSNTTGVWEDKSYEALKGAFTGEKTVEQACKDAAAIMNKSLEQEK